MNKSNYLSSNTSFLLNHQSISSLDRNKMQSTKMENLKHSIIKLRSKKLIGKLKTDDIYQHIMDYMCANGRPAYKHCEHNQFSFASTCDRILHEWEVNYRPRFDAQYFNTLSFKPKFRQYNQGGFARALYMYTHLGITQVLTPTQISEVKNTNWGVDDYEKFLETWYVIFNDWFFFSVLKPEWAVLNVVNDEKISYSGRTESTTPVLDGRETYMKSVMTINISHHLTHYTPPREIGKELFLTLLGEMLRTFLTAFSELKTPNQTHGADYFDCLNIIFDILQKHLSGSRWNFQELHKVLLPDMETYHWRPTRRQRRRLHLEYPLTRRGNYGG
jgi:hypothetical protein